MGGVGSKFVEEDIDRVGFLVLFSVFSSCLAMQLHDMLRVFLA